jgi:hypothetical protein
MKSEIKKATNISRNRLAENNVHSSREVDELFMEPWDELVIRFDKRSHQYKVKRVVQSPEEAKMATSGKN